MIDQVAAFCALLVVGYWLNGFDHTADVPDVPLRRLADRKAHASRIDPLIPKPPAIHHQ